MTPGSSQDRLERARERLLRCGAEPLTDAELIALLLGAVSGGRDALALAESLLLAAGGLDRLLACGAGELVQCRGLGPARVARLLAALELGRRQLAGPIKRGRALGAPGDAARCFRARLADLSYEVFGCLYLDTRHRLIGYEPLFRGTVDGAAVYPREILKRALHHNAAAVILGHNHPSGDCEPSEADRSITARVGKALGLVDIRLLDHLVVSRTGHVSLAERGWI